MNHFWHLPGEALIELKQKTDKMSWLAWNTLDIDMVWLADLKQYDKMAHHVNHHGFNHG